MKTSFKYILTLLLLLFLFLYLLFNTSLGNEYFNNYLSQYLSVKSKKEIVIQDINFTNYSTIDVAMEINQEKINIRGELIYRDGFKFKGVTSEFGGNLYFDYDINKNKVFFILEKLSLETVLKRLSYPIKMTANLFGTITYDVKNKLVLFDNQLREVRLIKNRMTKMISLATKIDMTKYIYDKSSFKGYYHKDLLWGEFKIDSGREHIYFKELKVHLKTKKITSYFDLEMEGQEVYGKIEGTTSNPKFNINISKLIKHQFHKNIKNMDVEIDKFSEKAKSILNSFF